MKYAVGVGSGTMIYKPSSIEIGSDVHNNGGREFTDLQAVWKSYNSSFSFSK
jgi:hypothetical protein